MDIKQMQMMLILAECESITTTARKLRVTQPALTYQLKAVERELGLHVFNRSRAGTTATPEGTLLLDSMKRIVADYQEAVRIARAVAQGSAHGSVRVAVNAQSRDVAAFLLHARCPEAAWATVHCGATDPVQLLRRHVVDFWSASRAALDDAADDLRFVPVSAARLSAFVPHGHPLSNRTTLQLHDLRECAVRMWPRGTQSQAVDAARDALARLGADVDDIDPLATPSQAQAPRDGRVLVYDDGFVPQPAEGWARLPLDDGGADELGLVYLASQEARLAPALEALRAAFPQEDAADAAQAMAQANRLLDHVRAAVREGADGGEAALRVNRCLEAGMSARLLLSRGLVAGMADVEDAFLAGDAVAADLVVAMEAANQALQAMKAQLVVEEEGEVSGTAVIGTVVGEQHDIGKDMVRLMLESQDIEVADLGTQATPDAFVGHVASNPRCNLLLMSVSTTACLDGARAVMAALDAHRLRERVFVMVGGGAASQAFADEVGADAYTESAAAAAEKARAFLLL